MAKKLLSRYSDTSMKVTEQYFFGMLIGSEVITHILHLQAQGENASSKHNALAGLYEAIPDLVDSIIETSQGAMNKILDYDPEGLSCGAGMEALEYLKKLRKMTSDNRYDIIAKEYSNIHNELDNFITILDKTIYKLTFLKDYQ